MIKNIWFRIAMLLAFAVLPATILQLQLQADSMALVFNLAEKTAVRPVLDDYLSHLKESAGLIPAREALYKAKFQEALSVKRAVEAFFLVRGSIDRDIRFQTLLITGLTLFFSLLLSILISRGIVNKVRVLMHEREKANTKLRDLAALENWQTVARVLVHELNAPITPIKLIATDIERKFATLDHQGFGKYLHEAQALVTEQITAIEAMMGGFTTFGKLPPPTMRNIDLKLFLTDFIQTYQHSFGLGVALATDYDGPSTAVAIDPKLMRDLLFNLCKNAAEANEGSTTITIKSVVEKSTVVILVHNTGKEIPALLKARIFDPYMSTKKDNEQTNMGLGLTIGRKIALDHGGDLCLATDSPTGGVTFRIELPLVPPVAQAAERFTE